MSLRKTLIICLILTTLIVPFIQLSIGFYYVNSVQLCPIQQDIPLIMSIGGVFQVISFAASFAFIFSITPTRFKTEKKLTAAQLSAKGSNRASQCLIGCITFIFGICAIIFFVLFQVRIYGNYKNVQWKVPTQSNYCLFIIFSSAFGLIIATYVAILLFLTVTIILLFGIGL